MTLHRVTRWLATLVGLALTAVSTPFVMMGVHDVVTQADNVKGSIMAGTFFLVLLVIGLGSAWWGIFSKHASAAVAEASVEHRVLQAAKKLRGKVTPATLAIETGLSLDDCQASLDEMVEEGVAETWVTDGGNLVYAFSAFVDPTDRLTARDPLDDDAEFDELVEADQPSPVEATRLN